MEIRNTDSQPDRDRQTIRNTARDRQGDCQAERQAYCEVDRQAICQTNRPSAKQRDILPDTEIDRQTLR